jgi:hypothetical protein
MYNKNHKKSITLKIDVLLESRKTGKGIHDSGKRQKLKIALPSFIIS